MRKFLSVLAAGALMAAPMAIASQAQGAPGGGFHSGGFRGGFGGGYGHRGGYPGYWGAAGLGFALGATLASPWYYGPAYDDGYAYYGYYGPYPYPPAPVYAAPAYGYPAAPPAAAPAPPAGASSADGQACGQWVWDQARQAYHWQPAACPPAPGA